jgi:metal-responsive CopG/Arc/MetJ family transcriptional regulator
MKSVHLTISEQEHQKLDQIRKETGISISEQVRRAIDDYLDKPNKGDKK